MQVLFLFYASYYDFCSQLKSLNKYSLHLSGDFSAMCEIVSGNYEELF